MTAPAECDMAKVIAGIAHTQRGTANICTHIGWKAACECTSHIRLLTPEPSVKSHPAAMAAVVFIIVIIKYV